MTAKKLVKHLVIGAAATPFDAVAELGGTPQYHAYVKFSNFHATQIVYIATGGVVAVAAADDTYAVGPGKDLELPFDELGYSLIATGATTPVEAKGFA